VAELIFTVSKLLNVDRLQRHDAAAIADDLHQSRPKGRGVLTCSI